MGSETTAPGSRDVDYDLFISHASEDKETIVRPLARQLQQLGLRVWLDECELTLGDSLRRKIDYALSRSRYGIVVLSPNFFSKEWPHKELDGLVAREDGREKVILPIWHNVTAADVVKFSPILAGKVAVSTSRGIEQVAASILEAVRHTSVNAVDTIATVSDAETASLEQIRQSVPSSPTSRELRRSIYRLESHLVRYPDSVEAKELDWQLTTALIDAVAHEGARARADEKLHDDTKPPGAAAVFGYFALLAAIAYVLLHLLGIV